MKDLIKGIRIEDTREALRILKAHADGERHPKNSKLVWRASANGGRGDWRVDKTPTQTKSSVTSVIPQGKENATSVPKTVSTAANGGGGGGKTRRGDDGLPLVSMSTLKSKAVQEVVFNYTNDFGVRKINGKQGDAMWTGFLRGIEALLGKETMKDVLNEASQKITEQESPASPRNPKTK